MKWANNLSIYLGNEICVERVKETLKVPLILAKRDVYIVNGAGYSFALVWTKKDEKYGIPAYKKQKSMYEELLQCNVAFCFDGINRKQRDALIQSGIPFVSFPNQIFLPFVGVALNNRFRQEKMIKTDKMTPSTQQLFLYMLYQKEMPVGKGKAAEALGLTRTSITRASEQLIGMGLIRQEKVGKEILMYREMDGESFYMTAKEHLINPVQDQFFVKREFVPKECLYAGETALSKCSMLNAPVIPEMAIYKGAIDQKMVEKVDPRWDDATDVVCLELWKYDPILFAQGDIVDPVSLTCTLVDCKDERVEYAIEEMWEDFTW